MHTKQMLEAFDKAWAKKDGKAIEKAVAQLTTQLAKGVRDESDPTSKGLTIWGHNQIVARLQKVTPIMGLAVGTATAKKPRKAKAKTPTKKRSRRTTNIPAVIATLAKREGYSDSEMCLMAAGYTHDGQRPDFTGHEDAPWEANRKFVGSSFTSARGTKTGGNPRLTRPEKFDSEKYQAYRKGAKLARLATVETTEPVNAAVPV